MNAIDSVIDSFSRLPGIGHKSAARIAYHLLKQEPTDALRLAEAVSTLHSIYIHLLRSAPYFVIERCHIIVFIEQDNTAILLCSFFKLSRAVYRRQIRIIRYRRKYIYPRCRNIHRLSAIIGKRIRTIWTASGRTLKRQKKASTEIRHTLS